MSDTTMTDAEWEESVSPPDATGEPIQAPDASSVDKTVEAGGGQVGGTEVIPAESKIDPETGKRRRTVRPRGWLEDAVKRLTDAYTTGDFVQENEKHKLTPHRVARIIKEREGLDFIPSTGAVSAVFLRWEQIEFATFEQDPFAFVGYTQLAHDKGLAGIKLTNSNARKAERDAEREAERAEREASKEAERAAKAEERAKAKEEKRVAKEAERALKKEAKATERAEKAEARKVERERKAAEKAEAKRVERERKAAEKIAAAEAAGESASETPENPAPDTAEQENDNSVTQN